MWRAFASWLRPSREAGSADPVFQVEEVDRAFAREGYVVLPFLEMGEIEALRQLHDRLFPDLPFDFTATTLSDDPDLRAEVSRGIRAIVEKRLAAMVPGYKVVLATFVSKRPRTSAGRVNLHQDWWLVDNRVHRALHFWCPLVGVGADNGCLKVVPGIHHLLNDPYPIHPPSYGTAYHPVLAQLEREFVRRVAMPAGAALVYDERMLHGSDENASEHPRVAFNCVMIPAMLEPIVYWCDEADAGRLSVLEVSEEFLCRHRYGTPLSRPYPDDVRARSTVEAAVHPLRRRELLALRRAQAEAQTGS
jgi:hypothetical protein